ncbi:MAG: hypothetical protein WD604_05285 [Balneolaceae bacterium]
MKAQNSTPKQSSGGGYQFENEVVAYFMTHLLSRSNPLEELGGYISEIQCQLPASEWHMDDLLLSIRSHNQTHKVAFSVKSNSQINKNGFPADFVQLAWQQILNDSSDVFNSKFDYVALITTPLNSDLRKSVNELLKFARDKKPEDLAKHIEMKNWANQDMRELHESAKCPEDLAKKHGIDQKFNPGILLKHLIWLEMDFESAQSNMRVDAKHFCQSLLESGSNDEANNLWNSLKVIGDRIRRSSGFLNLTKLVDEVRDDYVLNDFPDHRKDWTLIDDFSQSIQAKIKTKIAGKVSIPREMDRKAITNTFKEQQIAVLLGSSGMGKSAIAKIYSNENFDSDKKFWLNAEQLKARNLSEWRNYLGLSNSIREILEKCPSNNALLVLDGLDRLYGDENFATLSEFFRAIRFSEEKTPWKVLITCTPEEWTRVRKQLISNGIAPPTSSTININTPDQSELEAVWNEFSSMSTLKSRYHLDQVLLRPKVLDLLATHSISEETLEDFGESDLARLFWRQEIASGERAVERSEAVIKIADHFADNVSSDISETNISSIDGLNTESIDELIRDKILIQFDGRISFEHDLYSDWIRIQSLKNADENGELNKFLKDRIGNPIWNRAIKLFAIDLIEQNQDLSNWISLFKDFNALQETECAIVQDIFLEATAFASKGGSGKLSDSLWPLLSDDEGQILNRLLIRFLYSATVPNTTVLDAIAEANPELSVYAAAQMRVPYWPYWIRLINLLFEHRSEIHINARKLVARVAYLWLTSTPLDWPLRKETSQIAVALGEEMLKFKEVNGLLYSDNEADQGVYKALLAAGNENPDEVTQIILEAAGRQEKRFSIDKNETNERSPFGLFTSRMSYNTWAYGAKYKVDKALKKSVLNTDALIPLAQSLPSVAKETLLALLISGPRELDHTSLSRRYGLTWTNGWYPPFYTNGPFLMFLKVAQKEALETILQLINHATTCWAELSRRSRAYNHDLNLEEVEPITVSIDINGEKKEFIGNAQVFNWSQYGPESSHIIGSALMALEKHLYDLADSDEDLTPIINDLLNDCDSLAIIGVLSLLGRRHPEYFFGPLKGFLGSPHLLQWTISGSVHLGWQIPISAGYNPLPEPLLEPYKNWHKMEHRGKSLRDYATFLALNSELKEYFQKVRDELTDYLKPGNKYENWDFVENFIAQIDPNNYKKVEDEEGRQFLQYQPPESLHKKNLKIQEGMHARMREISLPLECERLLEQDEILRSEKLKELWDQVKKIENDGKDDVLPAVAAVILILGGEWKKENPDIIASSKQVILNSAREELEEEYHDMTLGRSKFVAKALPVIFVEDPTDKVVRELLISITLDTNSEITSEIVAGISNYREEISKDHKRLIGVVMIFAGILPKLSDIKHGLQYPFRDKNQQELEKELEELEKKILLIKEGFINESIDATIPELNEIAPLERTEVNVGIRNGRIVPKRNVEQGYLVSAFKGMPIPKDSNSVWFEIWKLALNQTLAPLFQESDEKSREPEKNAELWDRFLLESVAVIITSCTDTGGTKKLWQLIIDLGASASDWVKWFIRDFTNYALYEDAKEHIINSWIDMIDTALNSPRWKSEHPKIYNAIVIAELWRILLGLNHTSKDIWKKELKPLVNKIRPKLEEWAKTNLNNSENVKVFANFLTLPAATDIAIGGMAWLKNASKNAPELFWRSSSQRTPADDAILSLLQYIWNNFKKEIRRDKSSFEAFQYLLKQLQSRQYTPAYELANRLGQEN